MNTTKLKTVRKGRKKKPKIYVFARFPKTFADHLTANIEAVTKLSRPKLFSITSLLWENLRSEKKYQHSMYPDCFFVPHERMKAALGAQYLSILNKTGLITIHAGYNKEKRIARAYKLTDLAHSAFKDYCIDNSGAEAIYSDIIDRTGGTLRVGKNAIASRDSNNSMCKSTGRINPLVEINLNGIHLIQTALDNVQNWIYQGNKPAELTEIEQEIYDRLMKAKELESAIRFYQNCTAQIHIFARQTNRKVGTIPVAYIEKKSGRLYAEGLNPQTWPRELRKAAFNGQCDYDLENCHYAIFAQLAKQQGIATPGIDYYLKEKRTMRNTIAKDFGISIDHAKQCMVSLLFGSRLSIRKGNAIPDLISPEKAAKLFKCVSYTNLHADIKKARKSILKAHMKNQGLVNAMSKTIKRVKKLEPVDISSNIKQSDKRIPGKNKKPDLLSHILQGYEAKMLNIAIELHGESITLLQHDGFTSTDHNIDTDELCREIELQTGLKMSFKKELISIPCVQQLKCHTANE